jgi:alpha-beta hydrolase superfamily lysophospholipase
VRAGALTGPAFVVPPQGPAWQLTLVTRLARILPRLAFTTGVDADALSRDPEVGKAYLADALVHHRATAAFARSFGLAQAEALAGASSLRVPLLILQGDADRVVDPSGAKAIAARLAGEHELVMLRGYYHELLNEPEPERAHVLALLDRWIDRWLPA